MYASEALKVKLKKLNINMRKIVDIKGSFGLLAGGEAAKLEPSFRAYLKDNSQFVIKAVEASLQVSNNYLSNLI